MTNDITKSRHAATTTASRPTDEEIALLGLTDADRLVDEAISNLETAARIYKREKLTQPQMVERLSKLGVKCSVRTIQNVFASLRKAQDPEFQASQSPDAVRKRNKRATGQTAKTAECPPKDDSQSSTTHLSPGKSDESPFIECNSNAEGVAFSYSNDTILDVTPLQQRSGPVSFSEEVRSTQSEMDKDCPQQDDELVSMDTEAIRQRNADFAELERLIECSHDIIQRHFDTRTDEASKLTEWQWRDLSQQYNSLKYTVDIRWERLKSELAEDRADHQRRLDQCFGKARDSSDSTVPQLD